MTSSGNERGTSLRLGEGTIRGMGRRCRGGPRAALHDRDLAALLAGRRRRRVREHRPGAGRRPGGHRPLSRQGPHARRAAVRPGQDAVALTRLASPEPPRQLCRDRRPEGRAQRAPARALPELDRLGEVPADRHGLQPDVFRPPAGGRRLHPGPPRSRPSAGSGSITASPAGASAPRSARPWAPPA